MLSSWWSSWYWFKWKRFSAASVEVFIKKASSWCSEHQFSPELLRKHEMVASSETGKWNDSFFDYCCHFPVPLSNWHFDTSWWVHNFNYESFWQTTVIELYPWFGWTRMRENWIMHINDKNNKKKKIDGGPLLPLYHVCCKADFLPCSFLGELAVPVGKLLLFMSWLFLLL